MTATVKKLLKRDVVALAEGRTLGRPADLVVDPERHRLALVVVSTGPVPEATVVAQAGAVQSFTRDTLAIEGLGSLEIAGHDPETLALLAHGLRFRGWPVLDRQGKRVGRMVNVVVDESGAVVAYRVRRRMLGWIRPKLAVAPTSLSIPSDEVAVIDEPSTASLPAAEGEAPDDERARRG